MAARSFVLRLHGFDGKRMPTWFDIHEIPVTADSSKAESNVLKAVQNVHGMIDQEIAAGTDPNNIFVCGLSRGGALTLASVLLYPKSLVEVQSSVDGFLSTLQ
ncbi:Detected protein of confused Function [Hibiscus syriacus]|uniref:Detected protein of confused Function n=1 Tax=Hibiscus syriacus TaxID=106335 RepID=A0A6A3D8E9_HIBSY|nr:Detected protein of confused Function [Hibiscus syriacus]